MREIALDVLSRVMLENQHAHLELKKLDLSEKNQAFVSALVYTTLEHYLFLDYNLERFVDNKIDGDLRLLLLMSLAQIYKFDKVPNYAVVNEAVKLTKKRFKHMDGLVNAVLNRAIREELREYPNDELEKISIQYSMPIWILKLLSSQYSKSFAISYAKYCQTDRPPYVRLNPRKKIDDFSSFLEKTESGDIIAKRTLFQSNLLDEGICLIQDINSQKVVEFLDIQESMSVLDCCCGPGTKSSQILDCMNDKGNLVGIELHQSRSNATIKLLNRWGLNSFEIHTQDVLLYNTEELFDRILIDAPCSGLGVLSHKHDLKYHIKPSQLDELEVLQREIINHVSNFLKVDGIMVYATCTLNRKENERQIEKFLKDNDCFELLEEKTLDPIETKGDGFYYAQLRRIK